MIKYFIWGCPPGFKKQHLLITSLKNSPITCPMKAKKIKSLLIKEHGCTNVEIKETDY